MNPKRRKLKMLKTLWKLRKFWTLLLDFKLSDTQMSSLIRGKTLSTKFNNLTWKENERDKESWRRKKDGTTKLTTSNQALKVKYLVHLTKIKCLYGRKESSLMRMMISFAFSLRLLIIKRKMNSGFSLMILKALSINEKRNCNY